MGPAIGVGLVEWVILISDAGSSGDLKSCDALRIVYIGKCYTKMPAIILATAIRIVLALATLGDVMAKVSKYSTILRTITTTISCYTPQM